MSVADMAKQGRAQPDAASLRQATSRTPKGRRDERQKLAEPTVNTGTAFGAANKILVDDWLGAIADKREPECGGRIVVEPINDNLPERIETVLLRLVEPPYGSPLPFYEIGRPAHAGAIILDNDCPLRSPDPLVDGNLHLRLPAFTGMPFRLEASTNLLDWEEVASDINIEDGVSMVDEKRDYPRRFFRVVPDYGDRDEE